MSKLARSPRPLVIAGPPRVDLMPTAEKERRAGRALRRRWLSVCAVSLLVALGLTLLAAVARIGADAELANQQQKTAKLSDQIADNSDVSVVGAAVQDLTSTRAQAGGNDLRWGQLVGDLAGSLPKGVSLIGFQLAPGAAPTDGVPAKSAIGAAGTLTLSCDSPLQEAHSVVALLKVPGVVDVQAGSLTSSTSGAYQFTVVIVVDQSRYTGQFAVKGAK